MKEQDQYLKFVQWEEDDGLYVGYCPDLFPWGASAMPRRNRKPTSNCVDSCGTKSNSCGEIPGNCPNQAQGLCATRFLHSYGVRFWPPRQANRLNQRPSADAQVLADVLDNVCRPLCRPPDIKSAAYYQR